MSAATRKSKPAREPAIVAPGDPACELPAPSPRELASDPVGRIIHEADEVHRRLGAIAHQLEASNKLAELLVAETREASKHLESIARSLIQFAASLERLADAGKDGGA